MKKLTCLLTLLLAVITCQSYALTIFPLADTTLAPGLRQAIRDKIAGSVDFPIDFTKTRKSYLTILVLDVNDGRITGTSFNEGYCPKEIRDQIVKNALSVLEDVKWQDLFPGASNEGTMKVVMPFAFNVIGAAGFSQEDVDHRLTKLLAGYKGQDVKLFPGWIVSISQIFCDI